jgi:retron-type reverse transcriptase
MTIKPLNLYDKLCSYENLELAFKKARKGKTLKQYVIDFEQNAKENLLQLRNELLMQTYKPKPLETFILRDPKTRKISKSAFRDRIVHHAICNVIEPAFEKSFIADSYANRIRKGTLKAIKRFNQFKRKVSQNNTVTCYVLKADIRHYFDTVDHIILLSILQQKISDERVLWLIRIILKNYHTSMPGKGMPLGNLTSQFFANVYLDELDQFVKHKLRAKYYIRYVDDFVILDRSPERLKAYKERINDFLQQRLSLGLHPDKSKILILHKGVGFLGFRIFFHHKLITKKNVRKFERKLGEMKGLYQTGLLEREKAVEKVQGWLTYASHADTYKYQTEMNKQFKQFFPLSYHAKSKDKNYQKFEQKIIASNLQYSTQKTLYLFKNKKLGIPEIATIRKIKESTVWEHLANLIEHRQIKIGEVLSLNKYKNILLAIRSERDTLKEIRSRIADETIKYEEINCVFANIKSRNKRYH